VLQQPQVQVHLAKPQEQVVVQVQVVLQELQDQVLHPELVELVVQQVLQVQQVVQVYQPQVVQVVLVVVVHLQTNQITL
jgi:hypothetical protein